MVVVVKPLIVLALIGMASASVKKTSISKIEEGICSEFSIDAEYAAALVGDDGFKEVSCASLAYTTASGSKEIDVPYLGEIIVVETYTKPVDYKLGVSKKGDTAPGSTGSTAFNNNRHTSNSHMIPAGGGGGGAAHTFIEAVTTSWLAPFACYETTYLKAEWDLLTKDKNNNNSNHGKKYMYTCAQRKYTQYQTEWVEPFSKLNKLMTVRKYLLDPRYHDRHPGTNALGPQTTPSSPSGGILYSTAAETEHDEEE